MSTDVADTRSPWRQVADSIDSAAGLIEQIPGWDTYRCAPETDLELRGAAALLQRAVLYLRAAAAREASRREVRESDDREARGELAPRDRPAKRWTEDSD